MSVEPQLKGLFAPLEHREFRVFWLGFLLSHVGDSVQLHAQQWLVTDMTRSGTGVGAVVVAQAIPRLLLGLFAGVVVDRFDRRRLLLATQSLALVQALVFSALVYTHKITYALVVLLAFLLGVVDTLNLNARVAMLPTLVPREKIGKAIALQAMGVNLVQISGPSIAGLLIGTLSVSACLLFNALSFVAALVALLLINPPAVLEPTTLSLRQELLEGWSFVRHRPVLLGGIVLAWVHGFFGVSVVRLYALFARVVLNTDGTRYGLFAAAGGMGAIVASVLVTARANVHTIPRNIAVGSIGFSLTILLLSQAHTYPLAVLTVMLVGAGQMAFRSAVSTAIQLEAPNRLRGRVMSLLTLDFALWSFGAIATGALGDALARRTHSMGSGLQYAIGIAGLLCVLSGAIVAPRVARGKLTPAEKSQ
jgi:MFS family permease